MLRSGGVRLQASSPSLGTVQVSCSFMHECSPGDHVTHLVPPWRVDEVQHDASLVRRVRDSCMPEAQVTKHHTSAFHGWLYWGRKLPSDSQHVVPNSEVGFHGVVVILCVKTDLLRHECIIARPKLATSLVVAESRVSCRPKPQLCRAVCFGGVLEVVVRCHSARHLRKVVRHVGVHALTTAVAVSESCVAVCKVADWVWAEDSAEDGCCHFVGPDVFIHDFWAERRGVLHVAGSFLLWSMEVLNEQSVSVCCADIPRAERATHIVPDRLWIGLHAFGCFAHLFVEDGAVFGVDDVLEHDETISVEGDDGCGNVLFCHATRDTFFVRDPDGDGVLKLEVWSTHGAHNDGW